MTSDLDSEAESATELRRRRVFRIQLWAGVGCFVLANFVLYRWDTVPANTTGRWLLALLPLIPIAWIVAVIVLRIRKMDEYQVRLFFPGLAVGFTVTMLAAVTVGTLASAGLAVVNGGWAVAVLGLLGWELTNLMVGAPKA